MDVLCLDPGETTGWAVLRTVPLLDAEGQGHGKFALTVVTGGQSETWHDWREWVCKCDAVVVERFALYRKYAEALIGSEFVPSQVIGVAKQEAEQCGVEVVVQPASLIHYRAGIINPALKPTVDALTTGKAEHEWRHMRDAVAHGAHWLLHTTKGRRCAEQDAKRQGCNNDNDRLRHDTTAGAVAGGVRRAASSGPDQGRTPRPRRVRAGEGSARPRTHSGTHRPRGGQDA